MSNDIRDRVEAHAETLAEIIRCHEEQVSQLRTQLATCRAALEEACAIAKRVIAGVQVLPSTDGDRIDALRAKGGGK